MREVEENFGILLLLFFLFNFEINFVPFSIWYEGSTIILRDEFKLH